MGGAIFVGLLLGMAPLASSAQAATVPLGTAASFSVLAGSTVTNAGSSVINGDVGVSPGSAVTGFGPGSVTPPSVIYRGGPITLKAQTDLTTAYNTTAGLSSTQGISADLGGRTLAPGVYSASSSLSLNGTLTLDANGDPNAVFVFQAGSTLLVGTTTISRVLLINGARAGNVFWQVGSSATIGVGSAFAGNILALTSITMDTGATLDGRALARNGAVTLDSTTINTPVAPGPPPPPPPPPSIGADFTCAPAPANEPAPPPLPYFALQDRIDSGLALFAPALCPANEDPDAAPMYGPKVRPPAATPAPAPSSCAPVAGSQRVPVCRDSKKCPNYQPKGHTPAFYCHQIENDANVSDVGMFIRMSNEKPKIAARDGSKKFGTPHSLGQLWAITGTGKATATLETGWTVDPGFPKAKKEPHLFEFHTGDNYGKGSCYDACGLHGVKGSPIVAGQAISSAGIHTYGVELWHRRWWFYYSGFWYGYIKQNDRSWHKHRIKRFTLAQAGGEVAADRACPRTQMGDGTLGSHSGSANVQRALLLPHALKTRSAPLPSLPFLTPNLYSAEGWNASHATRYDLGGFNPKIGAVRFGGPGGCRK